MGHNQAADETMATASSAQREPSMEEILASIRRIIEDSDTARPFDAADTAPGARPADTRGNAGAGSSGLDFGDQSRADDAPVPPVANDSAPRPVASAPARSAQIRPIRADLPAPESVEPQEPAEPALPAAGPAIISDSTGRQVAAAFGELSEAFAASRRRSFDDMAQEMLRPMLQEWLDNNLPTLVERLVREEIERVARGT